MLRLRVFESEGTIKVWLCDEEGRALRELLDPIGDLPGPVDWARTVGTCRPLGDEGFEMDFVFEGTEEAS